MHSLLLPDETERLKALGRYAVLDTPPEASFDRITALAARLFSVPIALVSLIDAHRQWFKSCVGMDINAPDVDRNIAFCAHTIQQDQALVIPDAIVDPRFVGNPQVTGAPHIRFYAGAPLITSDGFRLGSLCVIDTVPHQLNDAQVATLESLAAIVIEALEARVTNQQLVVEIEQVVLRTDQLEATNKELDAFTYSVSHDLRAPLRHISGFADMLAENTQGTLDADGQHYLQTITRAAERMGTLIDNLLAFSRMGRAELRHHAVDLKALATEVRQTLAPEECGRNVVWRIADLPLVSGDYNLLRQVLINLFSNALKYSRPRDPAIIEVAWHQEDGEKIVSVRDNGVGYDETYAGKLFGVFQRLHRADEFEGTGIGLANVRRIISRHGGRTWAEGTLHQGATVYFSLPENASKTH